MKITIICDNEACQSGLRADWSFACMVEAHGKRVLFDTGADGATLLKNMKGLAIEPAAFDFVFLSHDHWDHTGGLADFLQVHAATVYVPSCYGNVPQGGSEVRISEAGEICDGIYSTGELEGQEQSLLVGTESGVVVIAGCAHPGVGNILQAASRFGTVRALIGGLHGFKDFKLVKDLELICPTHCTEHKAEIQSRFPKLCVAGGAGKVMEL